MRSEGLNCAAPRPRKLYESSLRLCHATLVAHHPASVVYWAGIRRIIKTCPEAGASKDHWQEYAKNMFGSTSRGGQQEGGSLVEGIVKADEAP